MNTIPQQDKTIDLAHYARMFWRHKGIIILCLITTFSAALIALRFQPDEFESSVVMIVEDPGLVSRDVLEITGGLMQERGGRDVDRERMAMLSNRITSRPFLERVVRMLRMHEDPVIRGIAEERRRSRPEVSVDEMAIRLLVRNIQSRLGFRTLGPGVYRVTVADYSPENARMLAWWISELFVDVSDQRSLEVVREAEMFGQDRLRRYDERLRQAEQAYEMARRGTIERELTPRTVRRDNLATAQAFRQRTSDEASRARIRARTHEEALSAQGLTPETALLLGNPELRDMSERLSTALQNEVTDRLAADATPGEIRQWPPDGTYGALRRDLLQRADRLVGEQYPGAAPEIRGSISGILLSRIDAEAHEAVAGMLTRAINDFRREAESYVEDEVEFSRLERDVARNRRLLEKGEDYVVATDVRRAIEMANLGLRTEILDPAGLPLSPVRPNRNRIMLASVILGGLLGFGLAFMIETMDPLLRDVEDFTKIVPEPVLGTIPLLSRKVLVQRGGFFLLQDQAFQKLAATRIPVQMVSPEGGPDADS